MTPIPTLSSTLILTPTLTSLSTQIHPMVLISPPTSSPTYQPQLLSTSQVSPMNDPLPIDLTTSIPTLILNPALTIFQCHINPVKSHHIIQVIYTYIHPQV